MEATGRTWEEFLESQGLTTSITDKDYLVGLRLLGDTANPNTGSNIVIPMFMIGYWAKVTVTAAQIKASGGSPFELIPTPGILSWVNVSDLYVARGAGAVDFDLDDSLAFGISGAGEDQFFIANSDFNPSGVVKNFHPIRQGQNNPHDSAFVMRILSGNNASTGDADIDVYMKFSKLPVKL